MKKIINIIKKFFIEVSEEEFRISSKIIKD